MRTASRRAWILTALAAASCMMQRGAWDHASAPATTGTADASEVTLVLLGDTHGRRRPSSVVAARLDQLLTQPSPAIVLWLGNALAAGEGRRCPTSPSEGNRLHEVVHAHLQRGGAAYATTGPGEWRCGLVDRALSGTAGGVPWAMPDVHYVVRVHQDGSSRVISRCDAAGCRLDDGDFGDALVDLVVLDITPFVAPSDDATLRRRGEESLDRLDDLLAALERRPGPPRLLVSHYPIEAAGFHGLGGGAPDATFHLLPPALQNAIARGVFAGALAAHDRAVYASRDISDAVKRSDRVWLQRPVFQVVSGSTAGADAGYRRLRAWNGIAFEASPYSPHVGFATVVVSPDTARAVLYARKRGRWHAAIVDAPLRPDAHPIETASPVMDPCPRCRSIPGDAR